MMKVVSIDFETANKYLESACALGIVEYEDGEIICDHYFLIKPQARYNFFTNEYIHHITKEDVEDKKEFYEYYNDLKEIFKDAVLIAHNALFDITVLNRVCDVYGLDHFENKYLDSVLLSRKVYPELYNHKLDTICDYLNIPLDHHNPLSDSYGSLLIMIKAMTVYRDFDLDSFINKIGIRYRVNK